MNINFLPPALLIVCLSQIGGINVSYYIQSIVGAFSIRVGETNLSSVKSFRRVSVTESSITLQVAVEKKVEKALIAFYLLFASNIL